MGHKVNRWGSCSTEYDLLHTKALLQGALPSLSHMDPLSCAFCYEEAGERRARTATHAHWLFVFVLMCSPSTPHFQQCTQDARLFNAIVGDLFPGVTIPVTDYGALQLAVDSSCTKSGLQPVPSFSTKVCGQMCVCVCTHTRLCSLRNLCFGVKCMCTKSGLQPVHSFSLQVRVCVCVYA